MKPHPRIRKTVKYGGAAVATLLLAAWFVSCWGSAAWVFSSGHAATLGSGMIGAAYVPDVYGVDVGPGLTVFRYERPEWPGWYTWHVKPRSWMVSISALLPSALLAFATVSAWRLDALARRREREGKCPKCHYDRTGLPHNTPCPECGTTPSSPQRGEGL